MLHVQAIKSVYYFLQHLMGLSSFVVLQSYHQQKTPRDGGSGTQFRQLKSTAFKRGAGGFEQLCGHLPKQWVSEALLFF